MMLEIVDEAEVEQEQKEANASSNRLSNAVDIAASSSTAIDEEAAGISVPAESAGQGPSPLETRDDQEATSKRPLYKRPAVLIVAAIVLLIAAMIGVRYWLYARSHESTDDAFIDGHIIQISPKASGYVAKVYVNDNQQVKAGDLIVELDARDYQTRLQQAKAALEAGLAKQNEARTNVSLTRATTSANIQQASGTVQRMRSDVESSRLGHPVREVERARPHRQFQLRKQISSRGAHKCRQRKPKQHARVLM